MNFDRIVRIRKETKEKNYLVSSSVLQEVKALSFYWFIYFVTKHQKHKVPPTRSYNTLMYRKRNTSTLRITSAYTHNQGYKSKRIPVALTWLINLLRICWDKRTASTCTITNSVSWIGQKYRAGEKRFTISKRGNYMCKIKYQE